MTMIKKAKDQVLFTKIPTRQSVKVLYQNLGGTWYVFADVNGEAYFSALDFIKPENTSCMSFREEERLEDLTLTESDNLQEA